MKILLDRGTTEFIVENKGKEGYRFAIHNRYINYDETELYFCYGDLEDIAQQFKRFLNGEMKKVETASTIEPTLYFIFRPKGAKAIREAGEEFVYYTIIDGRKKVKKRYYTRNSMIIEFDLCLNGAYGAQHWSISLTEEETLEFCNQWLAEITDYY